MKSQEPKVRSFPFAIMAILSERASASSKWWVVKIIVLFSCLTYSKISQIALLDTGSNPEEGSSKKTIEEFPIKAQAKDNFRLVPPLRFFVNFSLSLIKVHFSNNSMTS